MPDLMLELFSEEIPSRMQVKAMQSITEQVSKGLSEKDLPFKSMHSFVTPRRLGIEIVGLNKNVPQKTKEIRGPGINAPDSALNGFLKSNFLKKNELLVREEKNKGKVYFAKIRMPSQSCEKVVSEVLKKTISSFPWEKSMRWGESNFRWVRPLHSILCIIYDDSGSTVVPLEIDGIKASNFTFGHRFMEPNQLRVVSFADYEKQLRAAKVIINFTERKEKIWENAKTLAFAQNRTVVVDKRLLDEVAGLVEWPVVLMGEINKKFANLPKEILQVSMRSDQKFFSVTNGKEQKISSYITVANNEASDGGKNILYGNTKVLNARLADAKFFWDKDISFIREAGINEMAKKLERVTFHHKLGSQAERVKRIMKLAKKIAIELKVDEAEAELAASICKADLVSETVCEFPELQGVMGSYFAEEAGLSKNVSEACATHYSPLGPNDSVPRNLVSVCVSLAEKVEMIDSFWSINEKPTGSKDPYALRRAALGVIRILLENGLNVSVQKLFNLSKQNISFSDLDRFFHDRFVAHLRDTNRPYEIVTACVMDTIFDENLPKLCRKIDQLKEFVESSDGYNLVQAYKRSCNILEAEEEKDGVKYLLDPTVSLLEVECEKILFRELEAVEETVTNEQTGVNFFKSLNALSSLRVSVDEFFHKVQINSSNPELRRNRLYILNKIRRIMHSVAFFSRIGADFG